MYIRLCCNNKNNPILNQRVDNLTKNISNHSYEISPIETTTTTNHNNAPVQLPIRHASVSSSHSSISTAVTPTYKSNNPLYTREDLLATNDENVDPASSASNALFDNNKIYENVSKPSLQQQQALLLAPLNNTRQTLQ
jgi:hypothetical protein